MKTPDLKRFITDIEPEDSVIAHSPSEFLAQLSKQQQQNYDDEQESPDSPISEFNLEDTINQPTFMRTPSISKLLKDTALPDEPSTITMTQDQVTSMLTPSLARLLSKTRRESTDGPAPRESLSGMTFMKTPTLSKLLSKTDFGKRSQNKAIFSYFNRRFTNFSIEYGRYRISSNFYENSQLAKITIKNRSRQRRKEY